MPMSRSTLVLLLKVGCTSTVLGSRKNCLHKVSTCQKVFTHFFIFQKLPWSRTSNNLWGLFHLFRNSTSVFEIGFGRIAASLRVDHFWSTFFSFHWLSDNTAWSCTLRKTYGCSRVTRDAEWKNITNASRFSFSSNNTTASNHRNIDNFIASPSIESCSIFQ